MLYSLWSLEICWKYLKVTQKNQMNGIQNNVKSSENDVEDGTLDCASLPQSY